MKKFYIYALLDNAGNPFYVGQSIDMPSSRAKWPNQYAIYLKLYTPSGRILELETDVTQDIAHNVVGVITEHIAKRKGEKDVCAANPSGD